MWPHRRQPTRLPCPWDSPGKITGVGCHFLLQCMRVKSESRKSLGHVWLSVTTWTAAYQAPPSMGFSRQEYWSGLPLPSLEPPCRPYQITRGTLVLVSSLLLPCCVMSGQSLSFLGLLTWDNWIRGMILLQLWFYIKTQDFWVFWTGNYWSLCALEPVLGNRRSHCNEKPMHFSGE